AVVNSARRSVKSRIDVLRTMLPKSSKRNGPEKLFAYASRPAAAIATAYQSVRSDCATGGGVRRLARLTREIVRYRPVPPFDEPRAPRACRGAGFRGSWFILFSIL